MARLMLLLLTVSPMILTFCAESDKQGRYSFKVSGKGSTINEQVDVDTKKEIETFNLTQAGSGKDAGDFLYDFKRNLAMMRVPKARSCFLRNSTGKLPRPAYLLKLLKLVNSSGDVKVTTQPEENLKVAGELNDRSILSTEMKDLCAKLPIYKVTKGYVNQNDMDQMDEANDQSDVAQDTAKRAELSYDIWGRRRRRRRRRRRSSRRRRRWRYVCKYVYYTCCQYIPRWECNSWGKCCTCLRYVCTRICRRVCQWKRVRFWGDAAL